MLTPLCAGLFGFIASWIHWLVMKLTGTHYRFVMQIVEALRYFFATVRAVRNYAIHATLSALGIVLIPLAIFTTLHLRRRLVSSTLVQASPSHEFDLAIPSPHPLFWPR